MREVKFRAWNKYNGMMDVQSLGHPGHGGLGHWISGEGTPICCTYDEEHGSCSTFSGYVSERKTRDGGKSYCVLMQYTGLKDKNGKEIYEGDLLKLTMWNPSTAEVVFNRGAFCFRFASSDAFYHDIKYAEDSEIIGNIYENSELLT